jgi:hypothetical protein
VLAAIAAITAFATILSGARFDEHFVDLDWISELIRPIHGTHRCVCLPCFCKGDEGKGGVILVDQLHILDVSEFLESALDLALCHLVWKSANPNLVWVLFPASVFSL